MKNLKAFYYPGTMEEAIKLLKDGSEKRMIVAGGSSVSLLKDSQVQALVDITRLGLGYIREEKDHVAVGATATIQEIYQSPVTAGLAGGILRDAALNVASRPLRNTITMGGNISHLKAWSDMPSVLLALDAHVCFVGDTEKTMPARQFFQDHPSKVLGSHSIVKEVLFPRPPAGSGADYIKFSKTKGDYAVINVACRLEMKDGACSLARVAVGAASRLPVRVEAVEKELEGRAVDEVLIQKAAARCRESVSTVSNIWGDADYKAEVMESLIRRSLSACLKKALKSN